MNKEIDNKLFDDLIVAAKESPRKRSHQVFHEDHSDAVQRIFIGLVKGTYVKPHRHPLAKRWEMIMALKGRSALLIFDDEGVLIQKYILSPMESCMGVELPEKTWHTVCPIADEAVIMEIKAGPFVAEGFSEFADWAPDENTDEASAFLQWAETADLGDSFTA